MQKVHSLFAARPMGLWENMSVADDLHRLFKVKAKIQSPYGCQSDLFRTFPIAFANKFPETALFSKEDLWRSSTFFHIVI